MLIKKREITSELESPCHMMLHIQKPVNGECELKTFLHGKPLGVTCCSNMKSSVNSDIPLKITYAPPLNPSSKLPISQPAERA